MSHSRNNKKIKNNKIKILGIVIIIAILIFGVFAGLDIIKLNKEKKKALEENERLKELKAYLEQRIEYIKTEEYIELEARKSLRLVKPEELLFIFSDKDGTN